MARRIINYLNNKDMLKEIHRSKTAYCFFQTNAEYDIIVAGGTDNILDNIAQAKENKADRLTKEIIETQSLIGNKVKYEEVAVSVDSLLTTDLIFRVMMWDHIPIAEEILKKGKGLDISELFEEVTTTEYDIEIPPIPDKPTKYIKVNFPPFQHFKLDENNELICIGRSHWKGDLETGEFSKDHGKITSTLATMYMKLTERYATRFNWRNYCVDTETEALTQRGWLGINQITENDIILSYSESDLKWSKIKSIYRGHHNGLMHRITSRNVDMLITPNHKLVTSRGLVEVELIKQSDQIIIMGNAVSAPSEKTHSDDLVEIAGWIITDGCYERYENNDIKQISISQKEGSKANRIRNCLNRLNYKFSESGNGQLNFSIWKESANQFFKVFPVKNLSMDFILSLTHNQRELLINTMIDGDGWRRQGGNMSYCQKNKEHVDLFQALLSLSGKKSNYHYVTDHPSFGKLVDFYNINIFSDRGNKTRGECLNFNGGMNNGAGQDRSKGKSSFPNFPTVQYDGSVWCPETEYGCFVARRNGKIYLTGNTYNDEMRSQALLQLSQVGLQFDEGKSNNPFSYYTAIVQNSFTRVLNIEKRNQNLRDDILEANSLNPSYTRQNSGSNNSGSYDYGLDD